MGDRKLEQAKQMLTLATEDLFQYGGLYVLNVITNVLFPELNDEKEKYNREKFRAQAKVKLTAETLMRFEKRAVLEVVNDILYSPEANLESASLQSETSKAKRLALRKKPDSHTELNKKHAVPTQTNDIVELKEKGTAASPSPANPKRKRKDQVESSSPSNRPNKQRRAKQTN